MDYDNWLGGKFITNTVITCVENSWFTLLVVSNNFLQHRWCTFSFQMAQQQVGGKHMFTALVQRLVLNYLSLYYVCTINILDK